MPHATQRGLTLIEVLFSVAILAAGAVVLAQGLARGAHALASARDRTTAYAFSAAKLADLELVTSQDLAVKPAGHFLDGGKPYRWQVSMSPLAEEPRLQRLTLRVSWRRGGHDYESSFELIQPVPPEALEL